MKRILVLLLTLVLCLGANSVIGFASDSEQLQNIPADGIAAVGNIGVGLFDRDTNDGYMPFSEYGIAQNSLRIEYDEAEDRILYSYYTRATDKASELGMRPLQLQVWNSSGNYWQTATTGSPLDYNSYSSMKAYIKTSPVHGTYYRLSGYHYAKINGQDHTLYNETEYIYIP